MDYLYYIFGVLIFVAVVLFLEGAYMTWNSTGGPEAGRIARRLRVMSAGAHRGEGDISIVKERMLSKTPAMQRILLQLPRVHALDHRLLEQSGCLGALPTLPGHIGWGIFLLVLFVSTYLPLPLLMRLSRLAGIAAILPYLYTVRAKSKHVSDRIEQQLPDALDLIGRALRAGHAFPTALKMVGDEMSDPIGEEFRVAFDEVNFGIAMQDALMNLATRVPSTDLRYFVVCRADSAGNRRQSFRTIDQHQHYHTRAHQVARSGAGAFR